MLCKKVLPLLSEFHDGALDNDLAIRIVHHLDKCALCRKEYDQLSAVSDRLKSMNRACPPEYLHGLVRHRIALMEKNSWRDRLRNDLERRWSLIRTVGSMWYISRALGTIVTTIFFFIIIGGIVSPLYVEVDAKTVERHTPASLYGQQVGRALMAKFGIIPTDASEMFVAKQKAAINDLYFLNFTQNINWTGNNDTFSVVTVVDPNGSVKIENILEAPRDRDLLQAFYEMITSARCRPASRNGRTVSSHMIFTFDKVSVYD
ncbi:MAG TPA: zf-HC2 domain-containing protein [Acidobacteriota bacterium]|nr:zf-HC2 domain-containing protein [Acidobacteriota bacterium]